MIDKNQTSFKDNYLLLVNMSKREFKIRYLGSVLGEYWNLIHPIVMISIYTLIFSKIMQAKIGSYSGPYSYSIYLCSGLLAWMFFQESVTRGVDALMDNVAFMRRMYFPPLILFAAAITSALINFILAFTIFLIVLLLVNTISFYSVLLIICVMLLLVAFSYGIIISLGTINIFVRDIKQFTNILFQVWFWFTPIVYLTELLPENAKSLLYFNPAWAYIESMHQIIYLHEVPNQNMWYLMFFWSFSSLIGGYIIYRKLIDVARDYL